LEVDAAAIVAASRLTAIGIKRLIALHAHTGEEGFGLSVGPAGMSRWALRGRHDCLRGRFLDANAALSDCQGRGDDANGNANQ
jgi:hypothetical protein